MNLALVRQQIDNLLLLHPELAEDEFLRADMVEGLTDAHDFLRMLERRRQDAEHMTEAIAANIAALHERKARLEEREDAIRKLMRAVLETADLRKVELPEATISLRKPIERLVINDEASVPKELCYVKYTPNKTLIKAMLKGGTTLNWAALVPGEPGVTIYTS